MTVALEMTDETVPASAVTEAPVETTTSTDADASAGNETGETGQPQTAVEATAPTEEPAKETATTASSRLEDDIRRYQAERDRIEQYAKELVKKVSPFVEIDEYGNVKGPKQQEQQPAVDVEALLDQAIAGDKEALKGLLWISKEQARREASTEFKKETEQRNAVFSEAESVKAEFPDLYKMGENGQLEETPLLKETVSVLNKRKLDARNPRDIRIAALEAENRLIKQGLPNLEATIKKNALNKQRQVGANGTAISSGQTQVADDLKGVLSDSQEARLKKEGVSDTARLRIAKMVKQAKKEGGFYL